VLVAASTLGAQAPDGVARASDEPPGFEGRVSFTEEQAEAGRVEFERRCASCHVRDVNGDLRAPGLIGAGFRNRWGDRRVRELFVRMRSGMPPMGVRPRGPGFTNILAYLLQANGVQVGTEALDPLSYGTLGLSP
jgi:mono/diheme cytochrome c family protein